MGQMQLLELLTPRNGNAWYEIGKTGLKKTHILLSERYGCFCAGEIHFKDNNGFCEGSEL